MNQEWYAFLAAVQFLTRLPVPQFEWEDGQLDRAVKWFPLVGVIVGAICGLAFWIGNTFWSGWIAAILAVSAGVIVTGALHEDGLADTADGIGGGRDREKRLEIMRDSRIGSYGALALILTTLLKLGAITSFSHLPSIEVLSILVATHTISRAGMTGIIRTLPYARPESAPVSATRGSGELMVLGVTTLIAFLPILISFKIEAIAYPLALAALSIIPMRWMLIRGLGGWTGDGAGASQQCFETAFLLGMAAVWN